MNELHLKRLNKPHLYFLGLYVYILTAFLGSSDLNCSAFFVTLSKIYKHNKIRIPYKILLAFRSHDCTTKTSQPISLPQNLRRSTEQIPLIPPKSHKRLKLKWDHHHVNADGWRVTPLCSPFLWLHQLPEVPPQATGIVSGWRTIPVR